MTLSPTELAQLVERLRIGVTWSDGSPIGAVVGEVNNPAMAQAADALLAMQSRIAELEEALAGIDAFGHRHPGHGYSCGELARAALSRRVEELEAANAMLQEAFATERAARAALKEKNNG